MNVMENREAGLLKRLKGRLEKADQDSQEAKDIRRMIAILEKEKLGGD